MTWNWESRFSCLRAAIVSTTSARRSAAATCAREAVSRSSARPHSALKNCTASSEPNAFWIWLPIRLVYSLPKTRSISSSSSAGERMFPSASRTRAPRPICRKRSWASAAVRSTAARAVPARPGAIFCCSIPSAASCWPSETPASDSPEPIDSMACCIFDPSVLNASTLLAIWAANTSPNSMSDSPSNSDSLNEP